MVAIGYFHHQESNFDFVEYDNQSVLQAAYEHLNNPIDNFIVGARAEDGKIVGYLMGTKIPYFYNQNKYFAADEVVYVSPEYRGKFVGKRMISLFKEWAEKVGCEEVAIGTISEIATERTKKLYARFGFREVGSLFRSKL